MPAPALAAERSKTVGEVGGSVGAGAGPEVGGPRVDVGELGAEGPIGAEGAEVAEGTWSLGTAVPQFGQ